MQTVISRCENIYYLEELVGAGFIAGKPAIVSKPMGDGLIVLTSRNPMHRHVNHHALFTMLYSIGTTYSERKEMDQHDSFFQAMKFLPFNSK